MKGALFKDDAVKCKRNKSKLLFSRFTEYGYGAIVVPVRDKRPPTNSGESFASVYSSTLLICRSVKKKAIIQHVDNLLRLSVYMVLPFISRTWFVFVAF